MLFLSQPVGVGFSYAGKKVGYTNANDRILDHIIPGVTTNDSGRYSYVDPDRWVHLMNGFSQEYEYVH
jgi:hypothetical protein